MLVKICGITNVDDVRNALEAGADFVGLNLVAGPRRIDLAQADRILTRIGNPACVVVLVPVEQGTLPADVESMLQTHGVRRLQPYGRVTPEAIQRLGDSGWETVLVRHIRDEASLAETDRFLASCDPTKPSYVLFDAAADVGPDGGAVGGTGRRANWSAIAAARRLGRLTGFPPILLAGGLTPTNVATAIDAVAPTGVDVSSGVESAPGCKDRAKMEAFVVAARACGSCAPDRGC